MKATISVLFTCKNSVWHVVGTDKSLYFLQYCIIFLVFSYHISFDLHNYQLSITQIGLYRVYYLVLTVRKIDIQRNKTIYPKLHSWNVVKPVTSPPSPVRCSLSSLQHYTAKPPILKEGPSRILLEERHALLMPLTQCLEAEFVSPAHRNTHT